MRLNEISRPAAIVGVTFGAGCAIGALGLAVVIVPRAREFGVDATGAGMTAFMLLCAGAWLLREIRRGLNTIISIDGVSQRDLGKNCAMSWVDVTQWEVRGQRLVLRTADRRVIVIPCWLYEHSEGLMQKILGEVHSAADSLRRR